MSSRRPPPPRPIKGIDEAIAILDDHVDVERGRGVAGRGAGRTLDTRQLLAELLGNHERACPGVHLTGTNGKGSTGRMITALLAAHAVSVGTYSSPHLEHVVERITWNQAPI